MTANRWRWSASFPRPLRGRADPGLVDMRKLVPVSVGVFALLVGGSYAAFAAFEEHDRGQIAAVAPDVITLRERDGTLVTIPVAANARIVGLGRPADASQLRPNLRVLVFREANRPATMIQVERKGQ